MVSFLRRTNIMYTYAVSFALKSLQMLMMLRIIIEDGHVELGVLRGQKTGLTYPFFIKNDIHQAGHCIRTHFQSVAYCVLCGSSFVLHLFKWLFSNSGAACSCGM